MLQHSGAGKNTNQLRQNIGEDENSSVQANQLQGAPDGGLDGRVHQDTVSGTLLNVANQSKLQHETAASGSNQTQTDPISCCGFASQVGGTGDKETINQSSALSASGDPNPSQDSSLIGTSHTPVGTCTITQKGSVNGDSATNSDTLTPTCPFLTLGRPARDGSTDFAAPGNGNCTAEDPNTTSPFPQPASTLTKGVRNVSFEENVYAPATGALSGQTVEYQISYSNSGVGTANNVVVTDHVPSGATYVSCTASCSYNPDSNTITWNLGAVDPDTTLNVDFTATVAASTVTRSSTPPRHDNEEAPLSSNATTVTVFLADRRRQRTFGEQGQLAGPAPHQRQLLLDLGREADRAHREAAFARELEHLAGALVLGELPQGTRVADARNAQIDLRVELLEDGERLLVALQGDVGIALRGGDRRLREEDRRAQVGRRLR